MSQITVTLSDSTDEFVAQEAARQGYASREEYIQALVREAEKRRAQERLAALIQEGIDSGPAVPMTDKDWADLRQRLLERHAQRNAR